MSLTLVTSVTPLRSGKHLLATCKALLTVFDSLEAYGAKVIQVKAEIGNIPTYVQYAPYFPWMHCLTK